MSDPFVFNAHLTNYPSDKSQNIQRQGLEIYYLHGFEDQSRLSFIPSILNLARSNAKNQYKLKTIKSKKKLVTL